MEKEADCGFNALIKKKQEFVQLTRTVKAVTSLKKKKKEVKSLTFML